ncbi:MAG: type II toxin-antitoxin system RelE/ParE family toxin [Nitrospira sp.]|nr:type II toxin-antitoxin system RelE/ParE family toxin [Nitrospira sp.]
MAVYSLSAKAASDLDAIYEYTILRFGLDQAQVYLLGLQKQFQILAEQPAQGRQADALARGLRRWEYHSHIIFYMPADRVFGSFECCTSVWMFGAMCNRR